MPDQVTEYFNLVSRFRKHGGRFPLLRETTRAELLTLSSTAPPQLVKSINKFLAENYQQSPGRTGLSL